MIAPDIDGVRRHGLPCIGANPEPEEGAEGWTTMVPPEWYVNDETVFALIALLEGDPDDLSIQYERRRP